MNYHRELDAASRRTMTGPPTNVGQRHVVRDDDAPKQITRRELQLMFGLARGRSLSQIAMDLHMGMSTAKTHSNNLLNKTGCHTHAEVVSWGYRHGYMHGLKPEPRPAMVFTPREMSVLQYVVLGLQTPDIAHRLVLSVDSIKTYTAKLRPKMQARNMAHIAALAWQLGLVKLEWWEDLGVVQSAPLRSVMPAPEGYTGKVVACFNCGGMTMPALVPTSTEWVQDSIW